MWEKGGRACGGVSGKRCRVGQGVPHLEGAVHQGLIQVDDHAELAGVLRLDLGQEVLDSSLQPGDMGQQGSNRVARGGTGRSACSPPSPGHTGEVQGMVTHPPQCQAEGWGYLGQCPVLLHQQRCTSGAGTGLRFIAAQAAEEGLENAAASRLLGRGLGTCGRAEGGEGYPGGTPRTALGTR